MPFTAVPVVVSSNPFLSVAKVAFVLLVAINIIRYYELYAKHHKQEKNLWRSISKEKRRFLLRHSDWRSSILLSFGYDPLFCNSCNPSMLVLEVYYIKTALFEQYRKAMRSG